MAQRILMIGGTGLIGPWVLAGLRELAPQAELFVMNRRVMALEGATAIAGDRHDLEAFQGALEAARPDLLIDMSPSRSPGRRRRWPLCARMAGQSGRWWSPRPMSMRPSRASTG